MAMLIGIDIGTHAIKAVVLDPKLKYKIIHLDEELVTPPAPKPQVVAPVSGEDASADATVEEIAIEDIEELDEADAVGANDWEDAPTGVWSQDELSRPDDESAGDAMGAPEAAAEDVGGDQGDDVSVDVEFEDEEAAQQPDWVRALGRLVTRLETQNATIVMALPHGKAMTISVEDLPFSSKAKVSQILGGILQERLPMELSDVILDIQMVTRGDDNSAIVGFARTRDIGEFLMGAKSAGADPAVLGVPELMLQYGVEQALDERAPTSYAVVDMGHETTRVLVMHEGQPLMSRTVRQGSRRVTDAVAETFQVEEAEARRIKHMSGAIVADVETDDPGVRAMSAAIVKSVKPLVRDLRRTLRAIQANDAISVQAIYLTGGGAMITHMDRHLGEQLGVPVSLLDLGAMEGDVQVAEGRRHQMALAWSLGQQVVRDRARQRLIDFRQGPFVFRGRSSYMRRQLQKFAVAAAVLFALLLVALLMQRQELVAQREAMRAAVKDESVKLFQEPVYKSKDIMARINAEDTGSGGLAPRKSAWALMYELTTTINQETSLKLSRYEVDAERKLVQIYGTTTSPQAVDAIVSDLEKLECLKSIKKDKLAVRKEDEVSFELQIQSECS